MASNYPTSLDNFTNPTSNDSLNSPSHSLQHANINDAVEAIEAKLGIGASPAGSATSGYVLTAGTGGTTTWAEPSIAGLTLVKAQTIGTAVSSVEVTGAFSSTYDNYKIILSGGVASTNAYIYFSYNGITSGYYSSSPYILWSGTTLTGQVRSNQANSYAGAGSVNGSNMNLDVYNPFNTQAKSGTFLYVGMGTDNGSYWGGFYNATTTSQTGFTLTTSTGTLTGGTIRVYGYRNS